MENNKAVHKLKGLPPVYVINLDDQVSRWAAAESMLNYWEVENTVCLHMMEEKMI